MDPAATDPTAIALSCLLLIAAASSSAAYTNYTVGGNAGWFFYEATNATSANYSAWAASQTFNLGDYLRKHTPSFLSILARAQLIMAVMG